jgi:transposase
MKERVRRRPGKQPGAAGATLAKAAKPDRTVVHVPQMCCSCGRSLEAAEVTSSELRQVFDLPEQRLEVTEDQAQARRCRCGATAKAPFPGQARATTCHGPVVRAVAVYLMVGQHVPVARAAVLLSQVCGAPVSTGWLAGLASEAAAGLGPFLEKLRAQLIAEDVPHADETGARISGARYWFHVACTGLLTLLDCHEKRGVEGFEDIGVLSGHAGDPTQFFQTDWGCHHWRLDGGRFCRALDALSLTAPKTTLEPQLPV